MLMMIFQKEKKISYLLKNFVNILLNFKCKFYTRFRYIFTNYYSRAFKEYAINKPDSFRK